MGDHHALRAAGGAAGIGEPAHHLGLGFVDQRRGGGRAHLGQKVVAALDGPERQKMPHPRRPGDDRAAPLSEPLSFDDQRQSLGVVDDEGVIILRGQRMQRRIAQAHDRRRCDDGPGLDPVRRQKRHPIALAEAERAKNRHHPCRRVAKLAIGPAGPIVRDDRAVGVPPDGRNEHRADRAAFVQRSHIRPPSRLLAVSLAKASTEATGPRGAVGLASRRPVEPLFEVGRRPRTAHRPRSRGSARRKCRFPRRGRIRP